MDPNRSLTRKQFDEVIRRAAELAASEPDGGESTLNEEELFRIAREVGLEFHTWIPTMVQGKDRGLSPDLYALNGLGESAYEKPAFVPYYTFLCPSREEV